jgi:hypothetical protein
VCVCVCVCVIYMISRLSVIKEARLLICVHVLIIVLCVWAADMQCGSVQAGITVNCINPPMDSSKGILRVCKLLVPFQRQRRGVKPLRRM